MIKALSDLFVNRSNFKGRSSRSNFFFASVTSFLILALLWMAAVVAGGKVGMMIGFHHYNLLSDILFWVPAAFVIKPLAAISTRRVNDYHNGGSAKFPYLFLLFPLAILGLSLFSNFAGDPVQVNKLQAFFCAAVMLVYLLVTIILSLLPSYGFITLNGVPAKDVKTGFTDAVTERELSTFKKIKGSDGFVEYYCSHCGKPINGNLHICPNCLANYGQDGQTGKSLTWYFGNIVFVIIALLGFNLFFAGFGRSLSCYADLCHSRVDNVVAVLTNGRGGSMRHLDSDDLFGGYMYYNPVSEYEDQNVSYQPEVTQPEPSPAPVADDVQEEACNDVRTEENTAQAEPQVSETAADVVDLGLPSGTLWATRNLGARSETDYGGYYAPADARPYVSNLFGPEWTTPTSTQTAELVNHCTNKWVSNYKGSKVSGRLFTGPNGNTLFLPAAGNKKNGILRKLGSDGDYWTSSILQNGRYQNIDFTSKGITPADDSPSSMKFSVRPVMKK